MKTVEINQNFTLAQTDLEFIMAQPIPQPVLINLIQEAARLGICQGSSYLNVYWLGVLHGMKTVMQQTAGGQESSAVL